jgi:hypothetical protein
MGAIGEDDFEERKPRRQSFEQAERAVAVLHAGAMHVGPQQQAERVDQDMAFASPHLFARIMADIAFRLRRRAVLRTGPGRWR